MSSDFLKEMQTLSKKVANHNNELLLAKAKDKARDLIKQAAVRGEFKVSIKLDSLNLNLSLGQELSKFFFEKEGFVSCVKNIDVPEDSSRGFCKENFIDIIWNE